MTLFFRFYSVKQNDTELVPNGLSITHQPTHALAVSPADTLLSMKNQVE